MKTEKEVLLELVKKSDELIVLKEELAYWKERCRLAEVIIVNTPYNAYTTKDVDVQYEYNKFITDNGKKEY